MHQLQRGLAPGELVCRFFVPGEPIAQPRRWVVKNKKTGEVHDIEAPTRHPVLAWKDALRHVASHAMEGHPPVDSAIRLNVLLLMPRPTALRKAALADQYISHTKRPDAENCLKAIQDALTMIVWVDDSRVSTVFLRKRYTRGTESPGVLIDIFIDKIPW